MTDYLYIPVLMCRQVLKLIENADVKHDTLYLYIPVLMCVQVLKLIENAHMEHDRLYLYIPVLMCVHVLKLIENAHMEHGTLYLYIPVLMCVQVLKLIENAHVLACAPSNAAADLLAERLLEHLPAKSSLLRMCAYSRDWISVPASIQVTQYRCSFLPRCRAAKQPSWNFKAHITIIRFSNKNSPFSSFCQHHLRSIAELH